MAQTDFKKLVAYSSISHMGYVILGIAVWSAYQKGAILGLGHERRHVSDARPRHLSAGMFFLVGVIYDRAHHRNLDNFRGLAEPMPLYTGMGAVIFFAGMGLPGLCGFVGEAMVVLATWEFSKVFRRAGGADGGRHGGLYPVDDSAGLFWGQSGVQELQGHGPARSGLRGALGGVGRGPRRRSAVDPADGWSRACRSSSSRWWLLPGNLLRPWFPRSAWEPRLRRSASRLVQFATQSVAAFVLTQSWEQEKWFMDKFTLYRSTRCKPRSRHTPRRSCRS